MHLQHTSKNANNVQVVETNIINTYRKYCGGNTPIYIFFKVWIRRRGKWGKTVFWRSTAVCVLSVNKPTIQTTWTHFDSTHCLENEKIPNIPAYEKTPPTSPRKPQNPQPWKPGDTISLQWKQTTSLHRFFFCPPALRLLICQFEFQLTQKEPD